MNPKQRAAEAALKYVSSDTAIGLGTGSTAEFFLIALGEALRSGRLKNVRGVPTSDHTQQRARELGIELAELAEVAPLAVTIDGADEVTPDLNVIKGMGGALLREKIVAQNSKSLIIIADSSKRVEKLGMKTPLPVEVAPFAHEATAKFLASLGCTPSLRRHNGLPFRTDNGNVIYDCRFENGIDDPGALSATLSNRAGVVESGLFLGIATIALFGSDSDVQTLSR